MSRILIICNTHFQVVVAVQLKLTLFASDEVDVHVSDHSMGSESVADGLRSTGLFARVEHRRTKDEVALAPRDKIASFLRACVGKKSQLAYRDYDEIVFYNLNIPVYHLADSAMGGSVKTLFSGMEEGVLSYDRMAYGKSPELLDRVRTITGHPPILRAIGKFYCFFPELIQNDEGRVHPVEIPSLRPNIAEVRMILCEVFRYVPQHIGCPYIYFASSSDTDGAGYGEAELVLRLADHVGKSNLLVKKHPRDNRTIYEEAGLSVMGRSDIPWEIAQICGAADGSVCLTISSGSFINASALLGGDAKGAFLVPSGGLGTDALRTRLHHIENVLARLRTAGMCPGIQMIDFNQALCSDALRMMRRER